VPFLQFVFTRGSQEFTSCVFSLGAPSLVRPGQIPASEVSDSVRLEVANAYATWWNVANMEPDVYTDPSRYKAGASHAKQRAIELYQQFLSAQKNPKPDIEKRLKNLPENPKGSNEWDYFCEDHEG